MPDQCFTIETLNYMISLRDGFWMAGGVVARSASVLWEYATTSELSIQTVRVLNVYLGQFSRVDAYPNNILGTIKTCDSREVTHGVLLVAEVPKRCPTYCPSIEAPCQLLLFPGIEAYLEYLAYMTCRAFFCFQVLLRCFEHV